MRKAAVVMLAVLTLTGLSLADGGQQSTSSKNQSANQKSGWEYPVIKDEGPAWPMPHAAVQPAKGKIYKVLVDLTQMPKDPKQPLLGLFHASRTLNVFSTLGVPPKNIRMVAVFHGPASIAAMDNAVYKAKFGVDNPNTKIIAELKAAGVHLFLCGQALHQLHFDEKDVQPPVQVATAAVVVMVVYQNDGYALMPF